MNAVFHAGEGTFTIRWQTESCTDLKQNENNHIAGEYRGLAVVDEEIDCLLYGSNCKRKN